MKGIAKLALVPIANIFVGLGRFVIGLCHLVGRSIKPIKSRKEEATFAFKHMLIGLMEMTLVLGWIRAAYVHFAKKDMGELIDKQLETVPGFHEGAMLINEPFIDNSGSDCLVRNSPSSDGIFGRIIRDHERRLQNTRLFV